MTAPDLYLGGKRLDLAKRIGKGGEGEVYLLGGAKKAVKVYTVAYDAGREAKVRAMVALGLAATHPRVAFPEEIVTLQTGAFAGFTMKLVEGCRQIHELYGVKSRKSYYPKADFRFLVRSAANMARAINEVHQANCVIGDVNHSGILVAEDAKVALIDADSFQLEANGRKYPCLVGVPDFTPPELQGKSLAGVSRTRAHDNFGLAVAIFQILCMGRHPYAGRYEGADLTLEQFIARNLFAYSRARNNGVSPPVGVITLDDFPRDVSDAFERAFGLDAAQRPGPADWANILQGLEGRLSRCAANSMHFYPSAAKGCPWCKMEERSGVSLFLSITSAIPIPSLQGFDVEKAWLSIKAIVIPDIHSLQPKIPPQPLGPSAEALQARKGGSNNAIFGIVVIIAAIGLLVAVPALFIVSIVAFIFAITRFKKPSIDVASWQDSYREVDKRWDDGLNNWRERLGVGKFTALRFDLEKAVEEFRGLRGAKTAALSNLATERKNRQLNEYLDRFLIRDARIAGIGPAKKVTLASFGIESAADVNHKAIMGIPGFGASTAAKLVAWRGVYEGRFVYNPSPQPADAQGQAKVENEFAAKAATLAKRIAGGQAELSQLASAIRQRMTAEDSYLSEVALRRAQLDLDLKFFGVAIPPKATVGVYTASPTTTIMRPPQAFPSSVGVKCPQCGAPMLRRTARRGNRTGRAFWGCSRYPRCRGTRN